MKKLLGIWVLLLLTSGSKGQSVLTFTDLSGFPDVVLDGHGYNLTGYIKNISGNAANPVVIDIMMMANGNLYTIDNNYSVGGPIASGDSIFWSLPGFVFPPAAFTPGNHNDILIWPTNPSSNPNVPGESDTLIKEVFYANSAGFRTRNDGVTGLPPEIDLSLNYALNIKAVNEGLLCNTNEVKFFFQYEGGPVVNLGNVPGIYAPGDTVTYEFLPAGGFNLNAFITHYNGAGYLPHYLEFWAQESVEIAPIAKAWIDLSYLHTGTEGQDSEIAFSFFPNPAAHRLQWTSWGSPLPEGSRVEVMNLQGVVLLTADASAGEIDLSSLASGMVIARVLTPQGSNLSQRITLSR